MKCAFLYLTTLSLVLSSATLAAAPKAILPANAPESGAVAKEEDWRDNRWSQMDIGQFVSSSLPTPNGMVLKGLSIRMGANDEASVCYDTGLANLRAAWTGKFLRFDPGRFGLIKSPEIAGELEFLTPSQTGWLDARPVYRGFHLSGKRIVLSYQLGDLSVLESPWFESTDGIAAFVRTIALGPGQRTERLNVIELEGTHAEVTNVNGLRLVALEKGRQFFALAAAGSAAPTLVPNENGVVLEFPPRTNSISSKLFVAKVGRSDLDKFAALVRAHSTIDDLQTLAQAGPPRWTEVIEARGQIGSSTEPYAVDTIPVPYENKYNALMFLSGVDFFANGDAAVCSIHGDVWVVGGIDDALEKITWKRLATGLFQPLGLKIVNNKVHVLGKDQITILHDLNRDGEADYYENFCNQIRTLEGGHDYVTGLDTNSAGDLFYVDPRGLHRVSKDGAEHETIATGWRNPNGMSVGPGDVITVAPQEGTWTPSSAIFEVKPGGYYGFGGPRVTADRPLGYEAPLCWIPRLIDNSSASQVWVRGDKWGPLDGQLLNLSFGRASVMLVLRETVDGQSQGGVVPMKPRFLAGAMRGTFRPQDGQLYVVGSQGWQTSGTRDGSFQRVRYTGKNIRMPVGLKIRERGIEITFSEALESATAEDAGSYGIEQWNYRYSKEYGSKEYSVLFPDEVGHDPVEVKSARLLPDGRSVFLEIPKLQPVMQMHIQYNVNAADGKTLRGEIFNTINRLGK